jgi:hypothetical protein
VDWWCTSGQVPVDGSCEHDNEQASIKDVCLSIINFKPADEFS